MKQLYIVGNWKSNKTAGDAKQWIYLFSQEQLAIGENTTVVLCVPFTLLQYVHSFIEANDMKIKVGAQDVSPFDMGAYTGAVSAKHIKEYAEYVIIGHSERRQNFGETDAILAKKVEQAKAQELNVIYCVQGKDTSVPNGVDIVAYEPISAIGTGNPDTPESAADTAKKFAEDNPVLYGGSVTPDNVKSFTDEESISGVLVGGASLDAEKFCNIISYAQKT